jgi:tetratricopeptide (TPR) repeat protein
MSKLQHSNCKSIDPKEDLLDESCYCNAVKKYEAITKDDPGNPCAHYNLARAYYGEHMDHEALAAINKAIELQSDYAWSYLWRARINIQIQIKDKLDLVDSIVEDCSNARRLNKDVDIDLHLEALQILHKIELSDK